MRFRVSSETRKRVMPCTFFSSVSFVLVLFFSPRLVTRECGAVAGRTGKQSDGKAL